MRVIVLLAALAGPVAAQELVFSSDAVEQCMAVNTDPRQCIGASANACMQATDGGETTVGMGGCLGREWQFWDTRLNAVYKQAMSGAKSIDAELEDLGSSAPKQAPALRDMQRAWISFRDAKCDFERSQWGGGTGGGPATVACLMSTTGEQTLYLQAMRLGE